MESAFWAENPGTTARFCQDYKTEKVSSFDVLDGMRPGDGREVTSLQWRSTAH